MQGVLEAIWLLIWGQSVCEFVGDSPTPLEVGIGGHHSTPLRVEMFLMRSRVDLHGICSCAE